MPAAEVVIEEGDFLSPSLSGGFSSDREGAREGHPREGHPREGASSSLTTTGGNPAKKMRMQRGDGVERSSGDGSVERPASTGASFRNRNSSQQTRAKRFLSFPRPSPSGIELDNDGELDAGVAEDLSASPLGATKGGFHDDMTVIATGGNVAGGGSGGGAGSAGMNPADPSSFLSSLLPMVVPQFDFGMRFGGMPMSFNMGGNQRGSSMLGHSNSPSGSSTPRPGPSGSASSVMALDSGRGEEGRSPDGESQRSSSAGGGEAAGGGRCDSSASSHSKLATFPFHSSISLIESHVGVGFTLGSREKPYKCEQCGQCYKYLSAFTKHKEQNHTARLPGEKPFRCEVCGMQFKYLKSFKKHRLNHAVERLHHVYPRPLGALAEERSVLEMLARPHHQGVKDDLHHHHHHHHHQLQQQLAQASALVSAANAGALSSHLADAADPDSYANAPAAYRHLLNAAAAAATAAAAHAASANASNASNASNESNSPKLMHIKSEINDVVSSGAESDDGGGGKNDTSQSAAFNAKNDTDGNGGASTASLLLQRTGSAERSQSRGSASSAGHRHHQQHPQQHQPQDRHERHRSDQTVVCPNCRMKFANEENLRIHSIGCIERMSSSSQRAQAQAQAQAQAAASAALAGLAPDFLTKEQRKFVASGAVSPSLLHEALRQQTQQQAALLAANFFARSSMPPPGLDRVHTEREPASLGGGGGGGGGSTGGAASGNSTASNNATGNNSAKDEPMDTSDKDNSDGDADDNNSNSAGGVGSASKASLASMASLRPQPAAPPPPPPPGPFIHNLFREISAAAASAATANALSASAVVSSGAAGSVQAGGVQPGGGGARPEYDPGRPHLCPFCGKGFRAKENLKLHIRKHTGERPFECEFCGRAFGGKSDMNRHLRIHTGERPYRCDACGKTFARADYLSKHLSTHLV